MKTNFSPLLCPPDFSPSAADAARVAARLAVALQRPLRLVHAAAAISAESLVPAQRRLRREAMGLREAGGAVEAPLLREFPAGDAVVRLIREPPPALAAGIAARRSVYGHRLPLQFAAAGRAEGPAGEPAGGAGKVGAGGPQAGARSVGRRRGFSAGRAARLGGAATVLHDRAYQKNNDFLFMGSDQRHGVRRLVRGSLSRAILRAAKTNSRVIYLESIGAARPFCFRRPRLRVHKTDCCDPSRPHRRGHPRARRPHGAARRGYSRYHVAASGDPSVSGKVCCHRPVARPHERGDPADPAR